MLVLLEKAIAPFILKKCLRDKAKDECYDTTVTELCCSLIRKM